MDNADRNVRKQRAVEQCNKRIALLHKQFPRLAEISDLVRSLALEKLRVNFIKKDFVRSGQIDDEVFQLMAEREAILKMNGLTISVYEPDWECKKCKDDGYIEPGVLCDCLKQEHINRIFDQSGISEKMRIKTFSNININFYKDPQSVENFMKKCRKMVSDIEQGSSVENILLFGNVGRGKTHFAMAIANALLNRGITVIYKRFNELLDIMREAVNNNIPEDIAHIKTVSLLVIDDLGVENLTPFKETQLLSILDDRNFHDKPWIINTNLLLEEIEKRYGSRIADRMLENTIKYELNSEISYREFQTRNVKK
ncbi:MAG: ATP-binding protein [Peptococcaceae bacterium]